MTRIGATYPTGTSPQDVETRRLFGLFPDMQAWRIFRTPTQSALPPWDAAIMTAVPDQATIVFSSKHEATIDQLPAWWSAMPPERGVLHYSYWHECDNWKSPTDTKGDLDPDTWLARWQRVLAHKAALPQEIRDRIKVGPIHTDWALTHDPLWADRWERVAALPGVDFLGIDTYNIGYDRLRTPEEMFGPALEVARRYGLELVVAEWGQTDRGDPAACAAMIRQHFEYLQAQPDVTVACWFYNHGNNLDDRPVERAEFAAIVTEAAQVMTRAPEPLLDARTLLLDHLDGLEPAEVGIVPDDDHDGGYHCGSDRVVTGDYSVVESTRDKNGLTLDASALDVGMFSHGAHNLQTFSVWCVQQCAAGAPDTKDIREIIYSPDGKIVKRWDRLGRRTTGDSSHLHHTHFSVFRDATKAGRGPAPLFRRYLTTIGLIEQEDTMTEADFYLYFARAVRYAARPDLAPNEDVASLGRLTRDSLRAIVATEGTSATELEASLKPLRDLVVQAQSGAISADAVVDALAARLQEPTSA